MVTFLLVHLQEEFYYPTGRVLLSRQNLLLSYCSQYALIQEIPGTYQADTQLLSNTQDNANFFIFPILLFGATKLNLYQCKLYPHINHSTLIIVT